MRVVVEVSGGRDSLYALYLLKKRGYKLFPIFLKLFSGSEEEKVAELVKGFGLELEVLDLREAFADKVVNYFVSEYRKGRTPNPCAICNREIKFGREVFEYVEAVSGDLLATGHYARVFGGRLFEALEKGRSQAYFLSLIEKSVFERAFFPLGEVREKDVVSWHGETCYKGSKDICFLKGNYRDFLNERVGDLSGPIYHTSGKLLGYHKGIHLFTVGQRKGLGVSLGRPLYVVGIDPEKRAVYVGEREELYKEEIRVERFNWINEPSFFPLECKARVRYRTKPKKVLVYKEKDYLKAKFLEPQESPTPGQICVLNLGEEVLGGGFIGV